MAIETENAPVGNDLKKFWTERQTPKGEFGPSHLQKLEKLQPKLLPVGNESLIDVSLMGGNEVRVDICLYEKKNQKVETQKTPNPKTNPVVNNKKPPNSRNGVRKIEEKKKAATRSRSEHRTKQCTEKELV